MKKNLRTSILLALTASLGVGMAVPANASLPNPNAHEIQEATKTLNELTQQGAIEQAIQGQPTVATDGETSELQVNEAIGLKSLTGRAQHLNDKIVNIGNDHNIIYEALQGGDARAVIQIDSPDSPTSYSFEVTGEYKTLSLRADGGVDALDSNNQLVASVDAPWAYDADGDAVPTHFEVDGNTITQVVEHNDTYDYGIVADPTLREHIKKVIAGCLGVQPGTFTVWGVLEATFTSWDKAVKFLVRRIGVLGAVTCLGGIVYQYL